MIEEGLVEEINNIIKDGYKMSATALQGLGYKEIIGYLKMNIPWKKQRKFSKGIPGTMPKADYLV